MPIYTMANARKILKSEGVPTPIRITCKYGILAQPKCNGKLSIVWQKLDTSKDSAVRLGVITDNGAFYWDTNYFDTVALNA